MQPLSLEVGQAPSDQSACTGWLTKSSVYWPVNIGGESTVSYASYDMATVNQMHVDTDSDASDPRYFHVNVDQRGQIPIVHIGSKSTAGNRIHRMHVTHAKEHTQVSLPGPLRVGEHCQWCYFATDGSNVTYVSMDNKNFIERHETDGQKSVSIHLPSPAGMIVRHHNLWIVNSSHFVILAPRRSFDRPLTYVVANQIDLASIYRSTVSNPFVVPDEVTFHPYHLDVDNYGRVYITGALLDPSIGQHRYAPGGNQQLFILTDGQQATPSILCAGAWGMFGVNVFHSKLKVRMLTATDRFTFNLYASL